MRSIQRTLGRPALRNIALVCLADGLVGMAYGAIAVGSGLDPWLPVALSVLVLAGSAEFLFVGIVAAGGSPIAAAIAGLLVNARHLPFGLAVGDALGRGLRRVAGSHLMNDESVVFALGQTDPARRRAAYWACGVGIAVCWPLGALVGAAAGNGLGDPTALGLDAMFPAVLLALVLPALRDRDVRVPALIGGAVALAAAPLLPAGLPVLAALVGLLAGARRKILR
ncbi:MULTISPECIES: AzlC family ABC transporter permease [unclassified Rhodococcus (in: high G+C Gram-positive bacteria)]|uniref:AzlC family ABC transporter permease n=1 Tax=unclassified Rhodococcus (in: high G+C Gram-positive bacteria) TaxID=192944 RepID=UPI00163A5BF1|nr:MULTISPECIES: AzlC family ABC transporter permease [unclassified Rhodococcus (in: high G+C Gram-positive bacteria)]MBC2644152.1 AzlC family ABC transporter permease [Rhodococcus sp. 3A]MBC2891109.1 AzlC family ABC transporter permease [Rhodococcus sp. 4CII]